ncbi:NACHT domain-containing protein [Streptomyces chryseus]|uniref:NACHT domain-containing protein n=1 Tax=Streptomyces chryseus TaxID=68186 RepID=UPI001476EAFC|nr:NACHT domain-containing protein [Streptomyces chryseus]
MEPVVVGSVVGRMAAAFVTRSSAPVTGNTPTPFWSEESDERGALVLQDETGEAIALLTQDQVAQVSQFLEQPEAVALSQFLFIARLGLRSRRELSDLTEEYEETFTARAEEFCDEHGYNWANLASSLWQLVISYTESVFPLDDSVTGVLSTADLEKVTAYVGTAPQMSGGEAPPNAAFRDIVEILGSSTRTKRAREVLADIRAASERRYAELSLAHTFSHAAETARFDHEVLYVQRNLRKRNSVEFCDDSFLVSPLNRPRCVVLGNPGVGKSTMTQNLVHQLSRSGSGSAYAPLVVSCKDVTSTDGAVYILSAITRSLRDNLQLEVTEEEAGDLATLGRSFVIFDGIDEIVDVGRRTTFVRTVEAFANRYPLIPVLVTARRVGYNKAPFKAKDFVIYELDDFSVEQVGQYTEKWFAATERSEQDRQAFLRETENVPDVRTNPLMLSLLCALYRARGYIPRNRRTVYEACADLLFQRWDAMRHIEQPMDHRQYGTRLMQELALFFYKSPTAQAGVQEGQLRKLIATFFTDTASVDEVNARSRAQDFLDFCADRAWLLSYQGTDSVDHRLFGFTHRTFMEYFAAEALVRRARKLDEVVDEMVLAHEKDTSSVLADVIFQCADDKYDGGARDIVSDLMARSKSSGRQASERYLSLSLRVMNAAPLPPQTTDVVFDALLTAWRNGLVEEDHDTALAVFELSRDPRNRFIAKLHEQPLSALAALARWARYYWRGEALMFDPQWDQQMYDVASGVTGLPHNDPPSIAYLLRNSLVEFEQLGNTREWVLGFQAFGETVPGPVLLDLEELLTQAGGDDDTGKLTASFGARTRSVRPRVSGAFLQKVFARSAEDTAAPAPGRIAEVVKNGDLRDALIWACCALFECTGPTLHPFHKRVDFVYGQEWFDRVSATRTNGPGRRILSGAEPFSLQELRRAQGTGTVPGWFADWCAGRTSLLTEVTQQPQSSARSRGLTEPR